MDMQLLLRGVWRFHSDEGREFMGTVDNWLREHAVLHTTTGAYDPNANSLVEESLGSRKRGVRCLLHQANAPVCLWPAEYANEVYHHSKRPVPGRNDAVEPIVLEMCCQEKNKVRDPPGVVLRLRLNPQCAKEVWIPSLCKEIFVGWNRRVPHGIKIATFRDDGEVEEVFTSTTVRTRDTVAVRRCWHEASD